MRINIYDHRGRVIDSTDSIIPIIRNCGMRTFYVEYDSAQIKVVTKVTRGFPFREREDIVAVKYNGKAIVYGELPDAIMEKLGINCYRNNKKRVSA